MNDKEKKIIELLKEELPRMSDFKKGYLNNNKPGVYPIFFPFSKSSADIGE